MFPPSHYICFIVSLSSPLYFRLCGSEFCTLLLITYFIHLSATRSFCSPPHSALPSCPVLTQVSRWSSTEAGYLADISELSEAVLRYRETISELNNNLAALMDRYNSLLKVRVMGWRGGGGRRHLQSRSPTPYGSSPESFAFALCISHVYIRTLTANFRESFFVWYWTLSPHEEGFGRVGWE